MYEFTQTCQNNFRQHASHPNSKPNQLHPHTLRLSTLGPRRNLNKDIVGVESIEQLKMNDKCGSESVVLLLKNLTNFAIQIIFAVGETEDGADLGQSLSTNSQIRHENVKGILFDAEPGRTEVIGRAREQCGKTSNMRIGLLIWVL